MAGKNEYTVFDYLQWRGDLTLQQDPFNEVDNLVLCIIAYINLRKIDRLWSKNPKDAMLIGDVCARLTAADEQMGLSSLDYIPVMRAAAETERFRDTRLFAFESRNDEAKQMQFAAVSFLLPDGSVFIAYRGTDTSLVGWKENFNMSYLETVPAQARATEYNSYSSLSKTCCVGSGYLPGIPSKHSLRKYSSADNPFGIGNSGSNK